MMDRAYGPDEPCEYCGFGSKIFTILFVGPHARLFCMKSAVRLMIAPGFLLLFVWQTAALPATEPPAAARTATDPLSMVADYLCCRPPYCQKPLPCQPCCCPATLPDCYCRKPLPVVCLGCVPSCCDNYCRKPLPACLPPTLCVGGCGCQTDEVAPVAAEAKRLVNKTAR